MRTTDTSVGNFSITYYSDREEYEKELKERQRKHLENVQRQQDFNWRPCMHDGCPECHGTGVKLDGSTCIHMISCPCPKCTPYC